MRILSPVCFAVAIVATLFADAQELRAQLLGNQVYEPDSFRQVASDVNLGVPGRIWFRSTYADQGLGYEGSYLTLGAKRHVFEDSWDGRWLAEGRFHYGLEEGGFFANGGLERVFTLDAIGADLVGGVWYSFDGDTQSNFANDFSQVGLNAAIRTRKWDLIGNGYFPVGVTDRDTRGPDGTNVFFGSNILLQPGIDSALRGFDVTLRMRPNFAGFGNGIFDIGGYGYSSELVNFFGGGRVRAGFQTRRGVTVLAEVNHDDRFETTGALTLSWAFGGRGSAGGSGGLGNDLAETVRNDHIVRFNQEFVAAVDPATGLAYNVLHVNNTGDPAFGDGTFETPFASLAAAEASSMEGDILFVNAGDGSRQGLDTGITLQDRQQLLSVGGTNLIPLTDGTLFQIPGQGARPVISNPGGDSVVTLANDNTIRGINIDATDALNGIFGSGVSGGLIEDTNVTAASGNGVELDGVAGNWTFRRGGFNGNLTDGIFIHNTTDNSSVFTFEDVVANDNGFDGIHLENYRGQQISMLNNTTSDNGRHGVFIEEFIGAGLDLDIISHESNDNGGTGIFIDGGDGDLNIVNADVTGNGANGVYISNWSNSLEDDGTFIGTSEGGVTNLGGNQQNNLFIELSDPGLVQDVLVTDISISGGGRGLYGLAAGVGSELNLSIVNNGEFSEHLNDGLRLEAQNSGTLNVLIENDEGTAPLVINDNGLSTGAGITFFADGPLGQPASRVNATVRNVSINNDLESGFGTTIIGASAPDGISVFGNGTSRINLLVEDSRIESSTAINANIDNSGNGDLNNLFFRDLIIRGDNGILLNSAGGTLLDFAVFNSDIQSNGQVRPIATGGSVDDLTGESGDPFLDAQGDFGFFANVTGDVGGDLDNLTRIQFSNNVIRDFTFEAVTINTFGDAQLLAYINANQLLRNGPGIDNLIEFPDNPATNAAGDNPVNENELFFFDAVQVNAFGSSLISLRMDGNNLLNNYELGLSLNTAGTATINASINSNNFANDIGQDMDATAAGIATSFIDELAANNNGLGTMCIALSSNSFRSGTTFAQNSPNLFRVELDGTTNGFTDAAITDPGVTVGSVGICEGLISDEELFFTAAGFVDADTPPGGGFAPLGHE